MVSFNTSVQALTLLFQILDSRDSVNDRYFTNKIGGENTYSDKNISLNKVR
jgi:hypothetical protein